MSQEVLITRRQRILLFFANPGRAGLRSTVVLDMQKMTKSFVSWLSGPHGTSNFDCQFLIYSDLNYTTGEDIAKQFIYGCHTCVQIAIHVLKMKFSILFCTRLYLRIMSVPIFLLFLLFSSEESSEQKTDIHTVPGSLIPMRLPNPHPNPYPHPRHSENNFEILS